MSSVAPIAPSIRLGFGAHGRLSGLEPMTYVQSEDNPRSTFLNIGERCNVAGSMLYKKAIVDGDYDKAHAIALKQVGLSTARVWGACGCIDSFRDH